LAGNGEHDVVFLVSLVYITVDVVVDIACPEEVKDDGSVGG